MPRVVVDETGDTKKAIEDTKTALTTLGDHITLIMDSAKKDILHMLDTRKFLLTDPVYLRANSKYIITDLLRDHDNLRAKLPPQKPSPPLPPPPLPVVAGKNHTRRHKKKRGKKTRNRRKH